MLEIHVILCMTVEPTNSFPLVYHSFLHHCVVLVILLLKLLHWNAGNSFDFVYDCRTYKQFSPCISFFFASLCCACNSITQITALKCWKFIWFCVWLKLNAATFESGVYLPLPCEHMCVICRCCCFDVACINWTPYMVSDVIYARLTAVREPYPFSQVWPQWAST